MTSSLSFRLNALGAFGIGAVLLFAFADQLFLHEVPCPLCLLQRGAFVAAGFGFALNLRFGVQPAHYALTILASLAGAGISARHILLHIVPGTGTYGEALFGLHLYTWAIIAFFAIIAATALMMLLDLRANARAHEKIARAMPQRFGVVAKAALSLLTAVTLANAAATLLECGGGLCPDNPVGYMLLGG